MWASALQCEVAAMQCEVVAMQAADGAEDDASEGAVLLLRLLHLILLRNQMAAWMLSKMRKLTSQATTMPTILKQGAHLSLFSFCVFFFV